MGLPENRSAFLGRPMGQEGDLSPSFFLNMQETLIEPVIHKVSDRLPYNLQLELGPPRPFENILETILQRIEMAEICIFDITNSNPNVLFECGLRRAIPNAPFVLIACREGTPKIPFDIKDQHVFQYNRDDIDSGKLDQQIEDLSQRVLEHLEVDYKGPRLVSTDYVYSCYGRLMESDELLAWVATWPAFPNSWHEACLINCKAESISIAGPVDNILQLPGIFWRLSIGKQRSNRTKTPFNIYGKDLPATKMIISGDDVFLAPEASARTARYYRAERASEKYKELYIKSLEGARPVQESVYLFLYKRIQDQGLHTLSFQDLLNWFLTTRSDPQTAVEHTNYPEVWVADLLREWIPKCIHWVNEKLGWTRLAIDQNNNSKNFRISLQSHGQHLEKRHFMYLHHENVLNLPRLRLIVTNRCDQNCSYCPPENEDFAGSKRLAMNQKEIEFLLQAAYTFGFRKFSITGGEPIQSWIGEEVVAALKNFLTDDNYKNASIALQTNGQNIDRFQEEMKDIPHLSLKVSWHQSYTINGKIAKFILAARKASMHVAMNFVLIRQNQDQLSDIIDWSKENVAYLKILDLNWYEDLGSRLNNSGARISNVKGDLYWRGQYLSPIEVYKLKYQDRFGQLSHEHPSRYGIPMLETSHRDGDFFIRIKDSSLGSFYAPECHYCRFFVDKRRCQEGIYQMWITPSMLLKVCRHRSDLFTDLSETVESRNEKAVHDSLRALIDRFYIVSSFIKI